MLNIDKSNGMAVALYYKFNLSEDHGQYLCLFNILNTFVACALKNNIYIIAGNLVQDHIIPFRITPNLTKFITPYRKFQMINCLTVTGYCLTNSIDDISVVLKLLLKDEFMADYNIVSNIITLIHSSMFYNILLNI